MSDIKITPDGVTITRLVKVDELVPVVKQSYLDREIKFRLKNGHSHEHIAASCNVEISYVESLDT